MAPPGQRNDIAFVHALIAKDAKVTIADKGYDADHFCEKIVEVGSQVVIPPNAIAPASAYDAEPLQGTRRHRALLQQAQTVPPHRHRASWASSTSPLSAIWLR